MASRVDDLAELLVITGHPVGKAARLPNDTGWQLRLESGPVLNVFDSGTINVQGTGAESLRALVEAYQLVAAALKKQGFAVKLTRLETTS